VRTWKNGLLMDSLFQFRRQYLWNSFQKVSDRDQSLLKTAGAIPFKPLVGGVPVVVVVFTDISTSGASVCGLGIIGPNEAVTELIDATGVSTAGEFGS
jgi:hypothetical protein